MSLASEILVAFVCSLGIVVFPDIKRPIYPQDTHYLGVKDDYFKTLLLLFNTFIVCSFLLLQPVINNKNINNTIFFI